MRTDVPWVKYNTDSGEIEPVLDEDGDPRLVNANDIVYGVQRTCDAETASDYAYVLYVIAGSAEANAGEGDVADVGVEALDDATVQFTLPMAPASSRRLPACGLRARCQAGISRVWRSVGLSQVTSAPTVPSS